MDKAEFVKTLRSAADAIERDDPNAWKHATVLNLFTDVQNAGGAVVDARYDGGILILSTVPVPSEACDSLRRFFKQEPVLQV